jgi:hypothetical protein
MEGNHERHIDLSPGRNLEKKVNVWIAKIRTSRLREEIQIDLENIIQQTFQKDALEEIAITKKPLLVFLELFGHQLEKLPQESKAEFQTILDEITTDIETLRSTEN